MSNTQSEHTIEGIDKLKELVEAINICLFCTDLKTNDGATTRPMSAVKVCDQGNIWFFNQKDSEKNKEILNDPKVQLFFAHPGKGSYVVVNGDATITTDREKIEELWTPDVKIWFDEGKDDPNISLIKVTPSSAYFWDTDGNRMINILKMAASFVTGTNLVSGTEGEIKI
ncbi:general stress protein 26 [Flavobacterium sp. PL11]|jgi:general stress protein 26|uniref:pyridoxamine 5'-phosphate oxidase family protein n=1 Tax=Flavobacterium sp. PL11 TaxID=3071717 RepID=UPI002DFE4B36|nr:general stress protein 26 [Flavobacterium sp. PL11]